MHDYEMNADKFVKIVYLYAVRFTFLLLLLFLGILHVIVNI